MSKEHILTKTSLGIDIVAIIILLIYFVAIAPYPPITDLRGLLILSPPLFGIFGVITAVLGQKKSKTNLSKVLVIVNIVFICWLPIVWYGGTMLLGI